MASRGETMETMTDFIFLGSKITTDGDCSLPGSSVHGILQARLLEWVAIPFSRGSSRPDTGIKTGSPALQADSLPSETPGKPISEVVDIFSLWLAHLAWHSA